MPEKPLRPCSKPGCPQLTRDKYCVVHAKEQQQTYDKERGTAAQRGYDGRWQRYREAYLKRHPLCVHCDANGKLTPATRVDHIVAHKGDQELFWDPNNHQALCERCHNSKTAKEDGGFGRGKNKTQ